MLQSEILHHLQIEQLTPMQEAVGKAYFDKQQDLVLLSPTGSGKTLAFLLPLVQSLTLGVEDVQAIVLVPSRELALQIETVFKSMGTSFRAMSCYGGRPAMDEHRTMNGLRPSVIIGTPGRMNDHLRKKNIDSRTVRTLVIDEFDKCLEFGFHDEMEEIISQLPALEKRVLLSATDAEEIPQFTGLNQTLKLNFLPTETEEGQEGRLTLKRVMSSSKDKVDTLYNLLCFLGNSSSIVFCNHREAVDRVYKLLAERGMYAERFHGGMEQTDRERALYKFRNGSCYVLLSTDLAARGLDIPEIEHIIHYHLPVNEESFTHRNGRTARWDAKGTSYLLLHSEEKLPAYVPEDLETLVLPENPRRPSQPLWVTLYIGKGKKDKLSKMDIAGFFYKKGNLSREDVGQIDVKDHYSFVAVRRTKVKQLLMLIQGEKIKGMKTLIEKAE